MRASNKQIELINDVSDRALNGKLGPDDIKMAVLHVRWLRAMGEGERAAHWHGFYVGRFRRIGVAMPDIGKDMRSITSAVSIRKAGGRPSGRPAYCTHQKCYKCASCPARWGKWWDCTGRPVSGSYGVSVVNPATGEEVRCQKPSNGLQVKGCYFMGGEVFHKGKKYLVPRGVSVAHYLARIGVEGGE